MIKTEGKRRIPRLAAGLAVALLLFPGTACDYGLDARLAEAERQVKTLADRIDSEFEEIRLIAEGLALSVVDLYERREEIVPSIDKAAYRMTGNGCLYRIADKGKSALWASGNPPVDDAIREVAYLTEPIDGEFAAICRESPAILQVYYNDRNSLHRIYPAIDVLAHFRPGRNRTELPAYALADESHNPERGGIWVGKPFVDPLKRGWVVSAVAPVYDGDELLGVPGLDVRIQSVLGRVITRGGRRLMIVDPEGTLVAVGEYVVDLFALPQLKDHCYYATVMDEEFLRDRYNVFRSRYPTVGAAIRTIIERGARRAECEVNDRRFHLIAAPISELSWHLIRVEG